MLKNFMRCAGGFLGFIVLSNCASPGLDYIVSEPAYNTEAAKLREVAVMDFAGPHGHAFTASLDGMLRDATFEGYPWFEVSPYSSRSDGWSVSLGQATRIGRDLNVAGVWYGEVDSHSFLSSPTYEEHSRCVSWNKDKNCETRVTYQVECFDIRAEVRVHALLADVEQGVVVADEQMSDQDGDRLCRETAYYQDQTKHPHGDDHRRHEDRSYTLPYQSGFGAGYGGAYGQDYWEAQDRGRRMESRLVAQQASRLRKVIAPYERSARAKLMEAPSLPYTELITGFESALSAAKNGNQLVACRQFEALSVQFPDDASVMFNMGACAEMFGELNDANDLYQRANDLAGPFPTKDYTKIAEQALTRLNKLQLNQTYLTQQLIETGEIIAVEKDLETEEKPVDEYKESSPGS